MAQTLNAVSHHMPHRARIEVGPDGLGAVFPFGCEQCFSSYVERVVPGTRFGRHCRRRAGFLCAFCDQRVVLTFELMYCVEVLRIVLQLFIEIGICLLCRHSQCISGDQQAGGQRHLFYQCEGACRMHQVCEVVRYVSSEPHCLNAALTEQAVESAKALGVRTSQIHAEAFAY